MSNIPQHVAIIMDGNRRWAKSQNLKESDGHKQGAVATKNAVKSAAKLGVKYLTIYAFSEENWQRSQEEVGFLMKLLIMQVNSQLKELAENGVKIKIIGDRGRFSKDVSKAIEKAEKETANNDKLYLQVAFSYGSRQEILQAIEKSEGDAEKFESSLYTSEIPDPDLLIRTGGEKRISNFLLWQMAYTELYFTDKFWPEFAEEDFADAIEEYSSRERRYGKN